MQSLYGKTAVITGGARGIGLATARRLMDAGCTVTLWDCDTTALAAALEELRTGGRCVYGHACDVTDRAHVYSLAARAEEEMGRVDILINNAGYVTPGDLQDERDEEWERTVAVNLMGVIYATRALLPGMYARDTGHIVNISSAAGMVGVPRLAVYCATKWAVWGFTEAMRHESHIAGKKGVHWSSIHPSYLREGMFAGARLGFLGNIILPLVRDHTVIASAIVDGALRKGKLSPKRPRTLHLTLRLRGALPDRWFQGVLRLLGVPRSMAHWKGHTP